MLGCVAQDYIRPLAFVAVRRGDEVLVWTGTNDRGDAYQRLIGGGIDLGERAEDAARREFREELGVELADVRFRGVVEDIYPTASGLRREIGLVFDAEVADPSFYEQDEWELLDAPGVVASWRPLGTSREDLPPLFPPGLEALLAGDGPAGLLARHQPTGGRG